MQETQLSPEHIKGLLDYRDFKALRANFKEREIADIADVFSQLETAECIALFRLVPRSRRSDLFSHLEFERQEELVDELPDVIVSPLLNEMEPDNRTRFLEDVSDETRDRLLLKLDPEERQVASTLLSYPEDSVGRLMTSDFACLRHDMTVSQALEFIRWNTSLPVDFLHYLFVVGDEGQLIGEINLASLVVHDPITAQVASFMRKSYVSLMPTDEASEALEVFRKYERPYIPVVNETKSLLGIVTADDLFDVAEEEATEDIQQFGGHAALEDSYFHTPLLTILKKRIGWLAMLFIGGFFSVAALSSYQNTLAQWGFLTVFLTVIISTGGNSGTQAASLIIRGLAINDMSPKDWWRVLRRELVIGLALGVLLGLLGYSRVLTMGLDYKVGIIVSASVVAIVLWGVILGSMLPFLFMRLKLDPAVVSSPFITTIVDVTGILALINIALLVLGAN